jgi:putative transposase
MAFRGEYKTKKKGEWGDLNHRWITPEIRDNVVETILYYNQKTERPLKELIPYAGISRSKFYEWKQRYGIPNNHNGRVPRLYWLMEEEKDAIIEYAKRNEDKEGYRRLCYKMIDEDVAYASPSTVYRILKGKDLLNGYITREESKKGDGYKQPERPHEEWHTDITYVNVLGSFMFLVVVIDGYSRFVVKHELRKSMKDRDVCYVLQKAHERFLKEKPRIISDRGGQFISRELQSYLRYIGLKQTYTSVGYPESNGKIERFFKTAKEECIRRNSFLSIDDARKIIDRYIDQYNYERLHSAIDYVTPYDMLTGKKEQILEERKKKLENARRIRREKNKTKSNLFEELVLSDSR